MRALQSRLSRLYLGLGIAYAEMRLRQARAVRRAALAISPSVLHTPCRPPCVWASIRPRSCAGGRGWHVRPDGPHNLAPTVPPRRPHGTRTAWPLVGHAPTDRRVVGAQELPSRVAGVRHSQAPDGRHFGESSERELYRAAPREVHA